MDSKRQKLLEAFKSRAFQTGHFVLASGKTSSYYIDSKKALFNSLVIDLLGELFWEIISPLNPDAIGGLEVGAIPITAATLVKSQQHGVSLEGFLFGKKQKNMEVSKGLKGF